MNNCSKYIEQMNMYLDGELKGSKISELLEHIERCPNCKKRFESLKIISFQTREMEVSIPEDLHENIMRNVRSNARPAKRKIGMQKIMSFAAVAAAVFAILVSGTFGSHFSFGWGSEEAATFSPAANVKVASFTTDEDNGAPAEAVSDNQKSLIVDAVIESPVVKGEVLAEEGKFAFLKLFSGKDKLPEFVSEYSMEQDTDSQLIYVFVENDPEIYNDFEKKLIAEDFTDGGELKNASNIDPDASNVLYIIKLN